MIRKLTKQEFIERLKDNYIKFHDRLFDENNCQITFEEYYNEAIKEWEKQNKMADEELEKYRKIQYQKLVEEVNKMTSESEKEKFLEEEKQQITEEDLIKYRGKK